MYIVWTVNVDYNRAKRKKIYEWTTPDNQKFIRWLIFYLDKMALVHHILFFFFSIWESQLFSVKANSWHLTKVLSKIVFVISKKWVPFTWSVTEIFNFFSGELTFELLSRSVLFKWKSYLIYHYNLTNI